jgi:O-antigen/teichoic acid export membrane protein
MGQDLKTRAIRSTAWYVASRLTVQTVSWLATIAVARYLTPADYGLFAMAFTVIAALQIVQEFGLGSAIVQRDDLTPGQLNAIFWIVAGLGAVVMGLLWLAAPAVAAFYEQPRLAGIVRLLAVTFLLSALGLVPYSLLTKEIQFKRRSMAETAGAMTAAIVSVLLAYLGYGVWALTFSYVIAGVVRNVGLALAARWVPGTEVVWRGLGGILRFGMHMTGASTIRSLSPVVNRVIIGRLLGGPALGLYSMADGIATGPHRVSSSVVQQLSLPVFSKLKRQDQQLRRYYLKITQFLALAAVPAHIGMVLVAPDLVTALLAPEWRAMIPLFQMIALGMLCWVVTLPAAPLLVARGRAEVVHTLQWVQMITVAVAFTIGTWFGVTGLGVAWLVSVPAVRIVFLSVTLREAGISVRDYGARVTSAVLATAAMATVVLGLRSLDLMHLGVSHRLLLEIAVGGAIYAVTLLLIDRGLGREVRGIVHDLIATSRA